MRYGGTSVKQCVKSPYFYGALFFMRYRFVLQRLWYRMYRRIAKRRSTPQKEVFSACFAICQFRLCITASRTKALGVGLSPYPYQGSVASFPAGKKRKTLQICFDFYVAAATFHVPPSGIIVLIERYFDMKTQSRTSILSFRVTPEEKEKIIEKAFTSYREPSMYLRDCALNKQIIVVPGADAVAVELRRIGNNLNQLTREVHAGFVSEINLTEIREELKTVWQSLNALLQAAR